VIDLDLLDRVEQELVRVLQALDGSAHHVAQGFWAVDLAQHGGMNHCGRPALCVKTAPGGEDEYFVGKTRRQPQIVQDNDEGNAVLPNDGADRLA